MLIRLLGALSALFLTFGATGLLWCCITLITSGRTSLLPMYCAFFTVLVLIGLGSWEHLRSLAAQSRHDDQPEDKGGKERQDSRVPRA